MAAEFDAIRPPTQLIRDDRHEDNRNNENDGLMLDFRTLGPIEAWQGGQPIRIGDHWVLSDPFAGLGCEFGPQFERILDPRWKWNEPDDVRPLRGGEVLELAGLALGVDHTPGHTPGSAMFNLPGDASAHSYLLVGDVLYAGIIGRTDMPGGSRAQTLMSLKGVLAKADETVLLTGHGENSKVARERIENIFMRQAAEWDGTGPVPQPPPSTPSLVRCRNTCSGLTSHD